MKLFTEWLGGCGAHYLTPLPCLEVFCPCRTCKGRRMKGIA